jgi:hypothetical protein
MADRNAQIIVSLRNQASGEVARLRDGFRTLAGETQTATVNFERLERQFVTLQNSEIRAATATGQFDRALRLVRSEMDAAGQGTVRYNQLLVQQQSIQQRLSAASLRATAGQRQALDSLRATLTPISAATNQAQQGVSGLSGALGGLSSVAGGLGLVFGVRQLVDFGIDAGGAALALQRTQNATRQIAGDTKTYSEILAAARQQQVLFGGSLQENLTGLSGFAVQARTTGANLSDLIRTAQRLATLDPEQGVTGAAVALREGLSGDPISLARRFEIPRAAIAKLRDESTTAAEKLNVINDYLDKAGISANGAADAVTKTEQSYHRLGAAADDAKIRIGALLAQRFEPVATGATRVADAVAGTTSAFSGLEGASDSIRDLGGAIFNPAIQAIGTYNSFVLNTVGDLLGLHDAERGLAESGQTATSAINLQSPAMIQAAQAGIYQSSAMIQAAQGNIQAADAALAQLRAINQVTPAIQEFNANLQTNAVAAQISAAQSAILKTRQEAIAQSAQLAAQGMLGEGNQALLLAQKLGIARDQAQLLIDAQRQIAGVQHQKFVDENRDDLSGSRRNAAATTIKIPPGFQEDIDRRHQAAIDKQRQLQLSQFQLELSRATTAGQRVAILKRELATTSDTIERNHILAQIAGETHSTAKAHTSELTKQLGLEERIADSKEKQLHSAIDAQLAILDDRKQRRQDDQAAAQAQRIINSPLASAKFKDAASDVLARIPLEQARRQLDIREQLATAGGSVVNGRILQGQRTGDVAGLPTLPRGGATGPALSPLPSLPMSGPGGGIDVKVYVDGQQIAARIVTDLRTGLGQAQSAGAGRPS